MSDAIHAQTTSSLHAIINALGQHPMALHALSLERIFLFTQLLIGLRDSLSWHDHTNGMGPPASLPENVLAFLASALGFDLAIDAVLLDHCWKALRLFVWHGDIDAWGLRSHAIVHVFLTHGPKHDITWQDLYPRTRTCTDEHCMAHVLQPQYLHLEKVPAKCIRFTKDFGPLPMKSYHAKCSACGCTYYPEYVVQKRRGQPNVRIYNKGIPREVHVTQRFYLETSLCSLFTVNMNCAWVSASNNTKIYNSTYPDINRHEAPWDGHPIPSLNSTLVWNGFFILALLREHDERDMSLMMSDAGTFEERLDELLVWRNRQMAGPGQEQWSHYCDLCTKTTKDENGQYELTRAIVIDGVSVGRPCCDAHNCQNRLASTKERWCPEHKKEGLHEQCVVVDCTRRRGDGRQTCNLEEHRKLEHEGQEEHTAFFQLTRRLRRHGIDHPDDDTSEVGPNSLRDGLETVDGGNRNTKRKGEGPAKSDTGNASPRARFGRRRTHNEQLAVPTCGIIAGRATFYGAEAISAVREYLKALYPTQRSLPNVIFYDNACSLQQYLKNQGETHFVKCVMPVDVFHMKTKHKESDAFCDLVCNARRYPRLYNPTTRVWTFNSSAAEMVNAWFGGFQSIAREMRQDRYEFFLDEMIKQRNRFTVIDLKQRNARPGCWNREDLLQRTT